MISKKSNPWEFYAVEAMYHTQAESVTLILVPKDITPADKDKLLQTCVIQADERGDKPFAIFAVPVTLH